MYYMIISKKFVSVKHEISVFVKGFLAHATA